MTAYTSFHQWRGLTSFVGSLRNDLRAHSPDVLKDKVAHLLAEARRMEQLTFSREVTHSSVLDVGTGQVPIQMMYFARPSARNIVIGIDVERIVQRMTPWALIQVARDGGIARAAKTFGRWLIGADAGMRKWAANSLGDDAVRRKLAILQMDVQDIQLPDAAFDFVFSRSVLQHIKEPFRATREMKRVLKPGGGVYISLHLWTAANGYTFVYPSSWEWPHLRGLATPDQIDQGRNRLRLAEWRRQFEAELPGCRIILRGPEDPKMIECAEALRQTELADYSLEELIKFDLAVIWRKPA